MNTLSLRLKAHVAVFALVLVFGIAGIMLTEGLGFVDALYFSIVTIATVGYGDIVPLTPTGKLISVVLIITGVGTFLGVIATSTDLILHRREKEMRREKLNIIIGLFFSEGGSALIRMFSGWDDGAQSLRQSMMIDDKWGEHEYSAARKALASHVFGIDHARVDLNVLHGFLVEKTPLYLSLFENPYIMEHETFTDLLRAAMHLKEELASRESFESLPETDLKHLAGDIKRLYAIIVPEWLDYMRYLQLNYPYLFSLAARKNPFKPGATAQIG